MALSATTNNIKEEEGGETTFARFEVPPICC